MIEAADTMLENINEALAAMRVKPNPPDTPPAKPAKNADGFDIEDDGNPLVGHYIMEKKSSGDGDTMKSRARGLY